jgi:hypothetical protein
MTPSPYGYTVVEGSIPVYLGTVANCNEGWLATETTIRGCATQYFGNLLKDLIPGHSIPVIKIAEEQGPLCTENTLALADSRCVHKSNIIGYLFR